MKVLITGGAGFIGSNTAEHLLGLGWKVRVLDDLSGGTLENLRGLDAEFQKGDIRDRKAVARAMKGVDAVLHLAALVSVAESVKSPRLSHEINETGSFNVFEAAREAGVGRVAAASSAAVYGNLKGLPKREDMPMHPESPYAFGKAASEHYASVYASLYGLESVCLRYFNVYGPKQSFSSPYSGVISRFSAAMSAGKPLCVFGDGGQTRDFVYVGDVAAANAKALCSKKVGKGEAVNIGTGRAVSLLELAGAMAQVRGRRPVITFRAARRGDIRHSLSDISLAKKLLGYAPKFTLKQGLELTMKAGAVR